LKISASAFHSVVAEAASLAWTRDPFDRLICASARVAGASLLTKDAIILANEPNAFWDQPPVHPPAPHAWLRYEEKPPSLPRPPAHGKILKSTP